MVRADLDDYDSLVRAFDGAYGVFCMTNFFVTFSAEQETMQAANQARAAAAAGVQHAVWSTAEDTRKWYSTTTGCRRCRGVTRSPTGTARARATASSLTRAFPPPTCCPPFTGKRSFSGSAPHSLARDGVRTLTMPLGDAQLPGIAAEDIGRCAYAIFQDPARFVGETVGIAGEHTTGDQLAAGLSEVFGEPVRYQPIPAEVFRALPFPGADLAANMFQFVAEDNGYGSRRDVALARSLNPALLGFTEWVAATRTRVPAPV